MKDENNDFIERVEKNSENIPPYLNEECMKELDQMMEELDKEENEKRIRNNEELEKLKSLISYDFDFIESVLEDLEWWEYINTVEVEETENPGNGYPSYKFYIEKGDIKGTYKYMRQDDDGDYHNLVWQTNGGYGAEDSYSGFLLFPLKDGKYWRISYSC